MPTPGLKVAALVVGAAIGSSIYVVTPMIVSELTPQPQRAAMLAITSSIITLAGGIIGLLFIRPEADRARLAAHTVVLPAAVPARA